jgi:hypothetical protein
MTVPETSPVVITIDGVDITSYVPFDSINIEQELGGMSGRTTFTVENAAALSISAWDEFAIVDANLGDMYSSGYVANVKKRTRGVQVDFDVECAPYKVRLGRSWGESSCTGGDVAILSCLFSGWEPDLSSLFDLSGWLSTLPDLDMDFELQSLLEALDKLGDETGTGWVIEDVSVTNLIRNPSFENDLVNWWVVSKWAGGDGTCPSLTRSGVQQKFGGFSMSLITLVGDSRAETMYVGIGVPGPSLSGSICAGFDTTDNMPVKPSTWYTFSVYIYLAGATVPASTVMQAGDGDTGANIAIQTVAAPVNGSWERREMTFQTNSDTENLSVYIRFTEDGTSYDFSPIFIDGFMLEETNLKTNPTPAASPTTDPYASTYCDGAQSGCFWNGTAHNATSSRAARRLLNSNPDAPFCISDSPDLVNCFDAQNIEVELGALEGINVMWVVGGSEFGPDTEYEYGLDGQTTRLELEEEVFPASTEATLVISTNSATDASPTWNALTVGVRDEDVLGVGGIDVLWDKENHWLEFNVAPDDLTRSVKVKFRHKKRIVVKTRDEEAIAEQGIEMTDVIYDESITSTQAAARRAQSELAAKNATSLRGRFKTLRPGLHPGQAIPITNAAMGLAGESYIIQRVRTRFLGSAHAEHTVEFGERNPNLTDLLLGDSRRAAKKPPLGSTQDAQTVYLWDASDWDDFNWS